MPAKPKDLKDMPCAGSLFFSLGVSLQPWDLEWELNAPLACPIRLRQAGTSHESARHDPGDAVSMHARPQPVHMPSIPDMAVKKNWSMVILCCVLRISACGNGNIQK